ncbi:tubulin nucleotide-binding domain-like protein [Athelia psychrophila]|uniref:Tubulin nucleotide-binding domain-like protein n=1 Tax=Athelia psychrophila TaxID=1759441 RepID=A0A166CU36_9AGAM|nr:tubulin nucleotide-binding domain-like protein [Fibularhizoctonia sp. CBS 109695]
MREILYIQAGSLANYTGTHFWNTQESYFTYGDEADESLTDNDISFRESLAYKNEPLLCPRLLAFDRKANFGTLSRDLDDSDDQNSINGTPLWNGSVVEYRQTPIQKSTYHEQIDHENDTDGGEPNEPAVRYWSDFNRLYYTPKTVQKLPDVADWENKDGDWEDGNALFRRFDEDTALMEDAVRTSAEACDSLQGVQLTYDTPTFGGFTTALLTAVADEYAKVSLLAFPLLSDALSQQGGLDLDDHTGRRKALNDALCLRALHELVPMSVPIQSPGTWPQKRDDVKLKTDNIYHTSALLSAQIESCTLPLRLRKNGEDLASFIAHLNWRGTTHFAELSGLVDIDFDSRMFNYSSLDAPKADSGKGETLEFATRDVTRGFSRPQIAAHDKWRAGYHLRDPFLTSTHAPLYPIPTSFPAIFPAPSPTPLRVRAVPLFTSLSTTPRTSALFHRYAAFVDSQATLNMSNGGVNGGNGDGCGMDRDEIKELSEALWGICDGYDGEEPVNEDDHGEDEE